jgi:hypothetical protein
MPGCQPLKGLWNSVGNPHTCHIVPSSSTIVSLTWISEPVGAKRIVEARTVSRSKVSVSYARVLLELLIAQPGKRYELTTV